MRLILIPIRNISQRKVRSSLSILLIALGVSIILSVGNMTSNYTKALRDMNTFFLGDVIVIPRNSIFIQIIPIGGLLDIEVINDIKQINGVENLLSVLVTLHFSNNEFTYQSPLLPMSINFGIIDGRWDTVINPGILRTYRSGLSNLTVEEIILGKLLLDKYNLSLGASFKIEGSSFRVVGSIETTSGFLSRLIIMNLEAAQTLFGYPDRINLIAVRPINGFSESTLASEIETRVPEVKALVTDNRSEFVEPIFRDVELWNLGVITLLTFVNFILVATITTLNISEKRREIATLNAIGASDLFIIKTGVTEALILSSFGILLGIMLSIITSLFLISYYSQISVSLILNTFSNIIDPKLSFRIILLTISTSIFAGIIPTIMMLIGNIIRSIRYGT